MECGTLNENEAVCGEVFETDLLPFLGWVCLCYVLIVFSCLTIIFVAACVKICQEICISV